MIVIYRCVDSVNTRLEADCRRQSCRVATGWWARNKAGGQLSQGHVQCWTSITQDPLSSAGSEAVKSAGTGGQADRKICHRALVSDGLPTAIFVLCNLDFIIV